MKQHPGVALEEATTTDQNIPLRDKDKRKTIDRIEENQRCKFRVDQLVEKAAMFIQSKR